MPRRLLPGRLVDLGRFVPPGFFPRHVRAYVPSVVDRAVPWPAIVMFDGQNLFGDQGSYAGGWHAHEAVDGMTSRTVIPPIVIAIDHGGIHRVEELARHSDAFLDWVAGTLVPLARHELHLQHHVMLGGSSLGGLAALYGHFRHPDVFAGALAMSPSFWIRRGAIFSALDTLKRPHVSRLYVDCGRLEGSGRMYRDAVRMVNLLRERGYDDTNLMWRPDARGRHREAHWRRRLPKALRFLFRATGRGHARAGPAP